MDSQKIKVAFILALALLGALYLGVAAATAQVEAIAWVVGALGVVLILALGKHVWVLIPIALQLGGNIGFLPGAPAPWWGAVGAVFTIFLLRLLLRRHDFKFRWTWMEFAILLQVLAIAQAFFRNPTGLSVFGGDVVGGKPYIIFGFAVVAFGLMSVVQTNLRVIRWMAIFMVLMALIDGGLMLVSYLAPSVAMAVLPIYSGVSFTSAMGGVAADASDARLTGAKNIGVSLGLAAFTIFRPMSTLNPLKPIRFLLMVGCVGFILVSGFRSALALAALYAIVSSLVRRKQIDVIVSGVVACLLLVGLVMTDTVRKLPFGAQRILSVLPVNVRPDARDDANRSSEWRYEMWKLALTSDRYINNKLLGDGFAFRADELAIMRDAAFGSGRSAAGFDAQDAMMAKGSYHGFHVETIRMTGVLGLICALIGLGIFFRYAWLQIQHFRGRPEWGFVLYLCIPFLIHPFYMMLVFGAYKSEFPQILVVSALLKVLDNIRVRELAEARASRAIAAEPVRENLPEPGRLAPTAAGAR